MTGPTTRRWRYGLFLMPVLLAGLTLLSGCGGGSQASSSGGSSTLVKGAKEDLDNARAQLSQRTFEAASHYLDSAREKIASGKVGATGADKGRLNELSQELSDLTAQLESKRTKARGELNRQKEQEEKEKELAKLEVGKTKPSEADKKKAGEEAEAKKKAALEETKRKLAEAQREKDLKQMAAKTDELPKRSDKEEEVGEGPDAPPRAGGPAVPKEGAAPKAAAGFFKTYGKDPPKMSIDEVRAKGAYAFAYFQVFNKDPNLNKRIGSIDVVFKDAGNAVLFERLGTYEYSRFKADVADPTDQPDGKSALTGGSHEVMAGSVLQLVAVGNDPQRAARAKKVAITVNFEDGSSCSDTGPGSLLDNDKPLVVK